MFSIGEVSRRTGIKVPTVRYYEQMGLIAAPERSSGNQRRYDRNTLRRLEFIRHARELGFSLDDIRDLLRMSEGAGTPAHDDVHRIAGEHLRAVRARIERLKRLEAELTRISSCKAGTLSDCAVLETLSDHALCIGEH
ncbi:MerR family transcriptional regulator [Pseudohoeflea suaedae]|uniref:MerR family transcriptional regulator n=1 Tax=Pseudohoeflea suaedae TaxID=877384 RepID=A0A4R5PJP1_9HYPH|nr:helix-turn-helix domain-containing protein [Pseudohoeflea suaedae]TDH35897.1 MerR family transcriptional regulator [Pseudohoeflea suaedae]